MKKIAFVFPALLPMPAVRGGATETLIQRLIDDNEVKRECLFHVYCKYDPEAEKQAGNYRYTRFFYIRENDSALDKVKFLLFRVRRKLSCGYVPEPYLTDVTAQMKKERYDAVIVESALRFIPYLKKKLESSVLLHLHFDAVTSKQQNLDQALSSCDGVLCVSRFIEKSIRNYNQKVKTCVLSNVTDTKRFDFQRYSAQIMALKQRFGIGPRDAVVLYSGRLAQLKGVLELVKAFKLATDQVPCLKLILVGSAEYGQTTRDAYYEQLVSEIGEMLNNHIFMTGYVDHADMPAYYALADVAVLPTTLVDEAAPLSVLEALASGCYFIGSDSGAIPELAGDAYASIVARDAEYVENLARQLAVAARDHKRDASTEATAGRQRVLRLHNADDYYGNFLRLLQDMRWGSQ